MTRLLFIVGTSQDSGLVYDEGYDAATVSSTDADHITKLALNAAHAHKTAVIMCDPETSSIVADAFNAAGVGNIVVDRDKLASVYIDGMVNPDLFVGLVRSLAEVAIKEADKREAEAVEKMLARLGVHDAVQTVIDLKAGKADKDRIPTGLATLDSVLDGGLACGELSTLGALSGSGKTTLANQIADHAARSGRHVLFVTCEMSRYELTSMSVSRIARSMKTHDEASYIKVPRSYIQSAKRRAALDVDDSSAVEVAFAKYTQDIAPRMHVMEPDNQPTPRDIRRAAEALTKVYGRGLLVVVDYLQILRSDDERREARLAINDAMSELRKLAKDIDAHVMVISALNRSSIGEGVTQAAFRESSGIEYASDLQLGLQPRRMTEDLQKAKANEVRSKANEIVDAYHGADDKLAEIRILKNRAGRVPSEGIPLVFEARSSLFRPDFEAEREIESGNKVGGKRIKRSRK